MVVGTHNRDIAIFPPGLNREKYFPGIPSSLPVRHQEDIFGTPPADAILYNV